jgi:Zn-dependent protease/uncharacterized protein YndB with AHSA1/START domain
MFSMLNNIGPEIPIALLFLGLLGFRFAVTPRASTFVKASPQAVYEALRIYDGKVQDYGRTRIHHQLIDPERQSYRYTYTTTMVGGQPRTFSAEFRVSEQQPGRRIVFLRDGLEGKSHASELLAMTFDMSPEADGTRLDVAYHWGPRPILAQIVARSDLWGGVLRLKSVIETGVPNERPYAMIATFVAAATGILTFGTFTLFLGWKVAALVLLVLLIHEFGHMLAYRLIGQPWGRMMFLPFLGAIAMPRLPFETQAQTVFAALMGPGVSTLLALACAAPVVWGAELGPNIVILGLVTVAINIFNLVPAEPLDGGIALRSIMSRLIGIHARYGLLAIGAAITALGFLFSQVILVIFGGIAIAANLRDRKIDVGMRPLSTLELSISAASYLAMGSAYVTLYKFYMDRLVAFSAIGT